MILKNGVFHVESASLAAVAEKFGTPTYVYSKTALAAAYTRYAQAFAGRNTLICYAVKANPNLAILNLFARLGAGFDIVSGGELTRVLAAGADPKKIVFSGVGKSEAEIRLALEEEILCFNIESEAEMRRIAKVAAHLKRRAPISFRVNPNVDAKTHRYIATGLKQNKFGVAYDRALALYEKAAASRHLEVVGIDCHIGSQLTDVQPFVDALDRVLALVDELTGRGIQLHHIDLGGGIGIQYKDETPPDLERYAALVSERLAGRREQLILEPGRSLVGNAGLLLTRVEYIKTGRSKNFAIVDAAMNDLMRPALYEAWHGITEVSPDPALKPRKYDVVGPVCESGDFLGHGRVLGIAEGSLLAIQSAGAYGMSMSSNYNSRPRAAEIMVEGDRMHLIRERETVAALFAGEHILPGEEA